MTASNDWTLWQLIDSAFPTGGFAHSNGLEAAWQQGAFTDERSLTLFLRASLHQAASGGLPFVRAAWGNPTNFLQFDTLCEATLINHVANRASRAQGRALLRAAGATFGDPVLLEHERAGRNSKAPLHFAPTFGIVAAALKIDLPTTETAFLFVLLRGSIAAAVRLGIIGPMEAQRLQHDLSKESPAAVESLHGVPPEEACQTSPVLDLLHANQERLYSRLFQS